MTDMLKESTLTVRSAELSYVHNLIDPSRLTILFLHGFPDDANTWAHQCKHFGTDVNVIAPNLGKVGNANLNASRMQLVPLCMDMMQMLDHLGIKKNIVVVAHDMGGAIARELEFYLGESMLGVIYINSLGLDLFLDRLKDFSQIGRSYYMALFQLPFMRPSLLHRFGKNLLKVAYKRGGAGQLLKNYNPRWWEGIEFYRQFPRSKRNRPAGSVKSTVKSMFLCGLKDPYLNLPKKSDLEEFYLDAQIRVYEGGHWIHQTHYDIVNDIISRTIYERFIASSK